MILKYFRANIKAVDYNNSSTAKSSYPAGIVNYVLQHEPLAGLPSTETWLQSTAPWDVTFATPTMALDFTSPIFPNVDGYDLSSASGIQGPWSSIAEDLGSVTPPFLSPDLTSDSTEHSHTSVSSNSYKSSESWDYSSHNQTKGRRTKPLSLESKKKAALMRKVRACLLCRLQKLRVRVSLNCC